MPPLSDEDLATILRSMLEGQEGSSGDLASHWTAKIASANYAAQGSIRRVLAKRGYSAEQIVEWDDYGEFNEDIALFYIGVKGGSHINNDDIKGKLAALDRRAELETVTVTIGGVVVVPTPIPVLGQESASGSLAWPTTGSYRNPLLTEPPSRACGDIPYPGF